MNKKINSRDKLTGKQQAMVAERLKDRRAPNYEIIKRAGYKVAKDSTGSVIYNENLKKPNIAKLLDDVVEEVEEVLITDVRQYHNSDKLPERILSNNTARWIHDKVKGKAKQTIEQHSTSVNLNLDLTSITSE